MPLTVAHSTLVAVPDDGSSPIGSDEWNAAHTVTGTINLATDIPSGPANSVLWSNGATAQWDTTPTVVTVQLTAGVLAAPAVGTIEYDGNALYATPAASNRGVAVSEHFLTLSANQTGTNAATAQPWFPGGGATQITLPAATAYFFEGHFSLSRSAGTTSHTIALLFGGAATISSINYTATITDINGTVSALAAGQMIEATAATATVVTAATANATQFNTIYIRGVVRINGAGTFIPQFIYSAAPGGAPTIQANSYFRMYPIGTNAVLNVGNWS